MIKSNHSTSTSTRIFSPSPHASRVQELQWHSGGNTWEERSYSKWGKTRLKEILENIIIQFPEKLGLVKVTEVSHIEGDASVIQIRGRNKLIYDFSLHVLWKVCIFLLYIFLLFLFIDSLYLVPAII